MLRSVIGLQCIMAILCLTLISPMKSFAQAPTVSTYIVASDKSGAPVSLDPSTLKVSIGKSKAQIVSLRPAKDDKLLFAVLLDISKSEASVEKAAAIKNAAVELFQDLSQGGNQGYFVVFSQQAGMSSRPLTPSEVRSSLNHIAFGGGTAMYDAIAQTCQQPLSRSRNPNDPRRAIFLISDGEDNFSKVTRDAAEFAAQNEGVAIFSLLLSAPQDQEQNRGIEVLKFLSKDTGGELTVLKSLHDEVSEAIREVNDQWFLELEPLPPFPRDHKLDDLKLSSTQKSIMISGSKKILMP